MAASLHGDTPHSGKTVTSVPVTPYTTSVDANLGPKDASEDNPQGFSDRCVAPRVRRVLTSGTSLSETVAMAAEAFEGTITDLYLPRRTR